jgi:hypothetical protein
MGAGSTRLRVASLVTKDYVRELKNPAVKKDFKVPRHRDAAGVARIEVLLPVNEFQWCDP